MRAPPAAAGKHGACPHCKAVMEIPVTDITAHEEDIKLGKCTVLVEQGSHHKKDDQILIRFSCACCNKTLGIPVTKACLIVICVLVSFARLAQPLAPIPGRIKDWVNSRSNFDPPRVLINKISVAAPRLIIKRVGIAK